MEVALLPLTGCVILLAAGWWMSRNLSYDKFLDDQIKRDLARHRKGSWPFGLKM
jgi:uncharacterized membrane protein YwzB